jgi:ABC-2 type transport system permease protein
MRVVLASAFVHLRMMAVERFTYAALIGQPLLVATAAIFMLRHRPDFEAIYVVVGTVLTGLWTQALLFNSRVINVDRFSGRLEYLEASPAPLFGIAAGRAGSALVFSGGAAVVAYIVAAWLFGYGLVISDPAGFTLSAGLAVLSLLAVGMLLAPLSFRWIAFGGFLSGLEYPVYVLSGFLFPVLLLPGWLEPFSYVLPPYWAARALHATSSGATSTDQLGLYWLLLLLSSLAALALARWLFAYFLDRTRRHGLLGAV